MRHLERGPRAARALRLGLSLFLLVGRDWAQSAGGPVEGMLSALDGDRSSPGTARRIARLGEPGLDEILTLLTRQGPSGLGPGQRATLDEALGLVAGSVAQDFLRRATLQPGSLARDTAALWMYGALESAPGLVPMTRLANGSPAVLAPSYREAAGRIFASDSRAHAATAGLGKIAVATLLPALASAIGDVGAREGIEALVSLLGLAQETDAVVLQELARIAAHHPGPCETRSVAKIRPYLHHAPDATLACVIVLGRFEDVDSASEIAALLDSPDPEVSSAALVALQRIGRQRFPGRRALWEVWLLDQERWWAEEAPGLLHDLFEGDIPQVIQRTRVLGLHTLYRHALAPEVAALLEHEDPIVRRFACAALGQLGSALAVPALEDARNDEEMAGEAHRALALLTMQEGKSELD